jgi:hypothetical protein
MKVADNVQISCIDKRQHYNPHERIEGVGGMYAGKPWKPTETEAMAGIKEGRWKFYTSVNGRSVWVIIAIHNGREYLKTEADSYEPNNLLSLPECALKSNGDVAVDGWSEWNSDRPSASTTQISSERYNGLHRPLVFEDSH